MSRRITIGPDGRIVVHTNGRMGTISRCLPDTLTVALSGFAAAHPNIHRVPLNFSACAGSGATGYGTAAPPGETPSGVTDPTLTAGGEGFAALGRVEPTIGGDGNATATVTLTEDDTGPCGWPVWRISAVTITDPGAAWYTDGDAFIASPSPGVTVVSPASLRVRTVRAEPTIAADLSGASGSGGALSVTLVAGTDMDGRDIWGVDTLGIDTAGTGFVVDDPIAFTVSDGQEVVAAYGRVSAVGGSGEITAVVVDWPGEYFKDTGEADVVEVDDGGEYYTEDAGEPALVASVTVTADGGGSGATFTATVDDDPESETFGAIVGISGGGGSGYNATENTVPGCGEAFDGKSFVVKRLQCQGPRGAVPFASVDDDLADADEWPTIEFSAAPDPPEDGLYPEPGTRLEDATNWQGACLYAHLFCSGLSEQSYRGGVFVSWEGVGKAPGVFVMGGPAPFAPCGTQLRTETLIGESDAVAFTATNGDATAEVSEGGEYDPNASYAGQWSCAQCCQGDEEVPPEITATWTRAAGLSPAGVAAIGDVPDGDYVLTHQGGTYWSGNAGADVEIILYPYYTETLPLYYSHGIDCEAYMKKCIVNARFQGRSFSLPSPTCADVTLPTPACRPVGTFPIYDGTGELLGTLSFT